MEWQERLEKALATFDGIDMQIPYNRRMAVAPIYDFFQLLLQEVGVQFCSFPREVFADMHLNSRWRKLVPLLSMVSGPNEWDETITALNGIRSRTAHNDYYDPSTQALEQIRKRALKFKEFILTTGKEYYKQSHGVTFSKKLVWLSTGYTRRAKLYFGRYGDLTLPFGERDLAREEPQLFHRLPPLIESIEARASTISSMNDVTTEDLDNLVEIVREIERLDAREAAYVEHNKCPMCGNDIVETKEEFTINLDSVARVEWRVGCVKCEYVVFSDISEI